MSEYDVLINKYDALNNSYDQLYPKPMKHANTHANGGTDPITPSDIGAYNKNEINTLLANKAEKDRVVNPNLLDNWYFGNPVNQRGQTSYTGAGYGIDRWLSGNARGTFTVEADGITFSANSSGTAYFRQFIENGFSLLKGKTVSLTILYADNSLVTLTGAIPTVSGEATIVTTNLGGGSFGLLLSSDGNLFVQLARLKNYLIKVYAIKLELGSQQTLAHQDKNGNWVLNEIPDYGEQLARCQRYFQLYSSADIRPAKAVDCRPTMRADPAQGTVVVNGTTYYYNNADL